ncbi:MAG: DnaD domain protein [Acholeplasmataceae bacterium]
MNKHFWVVSHSLISSEDTKVLTLLYQPLIGSDAYGMYMFLMNLVDRNKLQSDIFDQQMLLDVLSLNKQRFNSAIDKLEAIGLLTTFLKEDLYLYRVNMPLNARRFLLDGILGSFLKSEIGEAHFSLLFSYFSQTEISRKGYTNITKSFDEVYKSKELDVLKSDLFIMGRKNGGGIIIKDSFDFEVLFNNLPIRLKKKRIFTKRIQSQIASVMYVYNFSIHEMIDILSKSYDEENTTLFYERIAINAQSYFNNTYGEHIVHIEKKKEEHKLDLSKIRPQDLIQVFGENMTNKAYALETIRQFMERNAVDIGLINAVIITSLKYNENLPHINYLEKVLADWLSRGIKTGDDAMPIIEGLDHRRPKTKRHSKDEPDWLDDIMDAIGEQWDA